MGMVMSDDGTGYLSDSHWGPIGNRHADQECQRMDQSILLSVERQMREDARRQELKEWMWCAGICAVILAVTSGVCAVLE